MHRSTRPTAQQGARTVSMADVAAAAGVSQQTVSRVVNHQTNVREETRRRVEEAMRALDFRPNFAGRSLRGGSYRAIGLSMFDVTRAGNTVTLNGIVSPLVLLGVILGLVF